MKQKHWQNIFHWIVNAKLIVQYVIQIKDGISINAKTSAKRIVHAKKSIVTILAHPFLRIVAI